MDINVKARKWGNSLAIILPKRMVEVSKIKENDDLVVEVKKKHFAGEFFGLFSDWKTPTQKIKDEMREGW